MTKSNIDNNTKLKTLGHRPRTMAHIHPVKILYLQSSANKKNTWQFLSMNHKHTNMPSHDSI